MTDRAVREEPRPDRLPRPERRVVPAASQVLATETRILGAHLDMPQTRMETVTPDPKDGPPDALRYLRHDRGCSIGFGPDCSCGMLKAESELLTALRVVPPEGGPPNAVSLLREYLAHKPGCVHDDNSMTPRCPCGLLQAIGELLRLEPNNDTANLRSEPNGMPSEPSEEARAAALKQYHKTTAYWAPELMRSEAHIEKLVGDIVPAAYAAERGVSAVPPTERHVCGLRGYDPMQDPPCPACHAGALRAEALRAVSPSQGAGTRRESAIDECGHQDLG